MNNELTTLMNTLMQNNLAGSLEEAKRMAESMLGTSSKVSQPYQDNKEHFMVKGFKRSESETMGKNEQVEEQNHPPAFEDMQEKAEELVHHHQDLEKEGPQKLSLNNPTTYEKEPELKSTGNSTLSLTNTVMTQERPKVETQEGVLAAGMPNTESITNSQNIDPVTSAPLDIEHKKTEAQIPAADPEEFKPEIINQVREQVEHVDKPVEPLPSADPLKIVERVQNDLTPSDMTPEEYAAKRMGGESLNTMSNQQEQHQAVTENLEQVQFEHPESVPEAELEKEEVHNPVHGNPQEQHQAVTENLEQVQFEHSEPVLQEVQETKPVQNTVEEPAQQVQEPVPQQQFQNQEGIPQQQVEQVPQETKQEIAPQQVTPQQVASEPVPQVAPQQAAPETTQEIPTQSNTEEKNEFGTPKRDKVELSAEDKKLRDDVDLSKVFNMGGK